VAQTGATPDQGSPLEEFRDAGRVLFSMGLVKGGEGNLSTFDGRVLRITRTGCELASLEAGDLVEGASDGTLPSASSDLEVHRATYRERGAGAVCHAHPQGTVPEGVPESGAHGVYAFAPTLPGAVAEAVRLGRESGP
jgi:Class II Aldolase and Adducin N-terminal domain